MKFAILMALVTLFSPFQANAQQMESLNVGGIPIGSECLKSSSTKLCHSSPFAVMI
jgi:hypothetical protein